MVAGSNVQWLGSKIRQCSRESGAWNVNLWGSVHSETFYFISFHHRKSINQYDET